jgi:hypothetical protein
MKFLEKIKRIMRPKNKPSTKTASNPWKDKAFWMLWLKRAGIVVVIFLAS